MNYLHIINVFLQAIVLKVSKAVDTISVNHVHRVQADSRKKSMDSSCFELPAAKRIPVPPVLPPTPSRVLPSPMLAFTHPNTNKQLFTFFNFYSSLSNTKEAPLPLMLTSTPQSVPPVPTCTPTNIPSKSPNVSVSIILT